LADLKESNPVEVAEYAATKSLLNSPDFVWWAHMSFKGAPGLLPM
jgi:hypothetical protein